MMLTSAVSVVRKLFEVKHVKCLNCKHILPDDSEFCQYCGNKIEPIITTTTAQPKSVSTPSIFSDESLVFDPSTSSDPLKVIMETEPVVPPLDKKQTKQVQMVSQRKHRAIIIILTIICILLVAALVVQHYMYKKAVKDTEQQLIIANNTIETNSNIITELKNNISSQIGTINSQKTQIFKLEDDANHYNEIIQYSKGEDFGYAANNFQTSTGVIVIDKDDDTYRFTLTAHWTNGGTVKVDYSSSAAQILFEKSEWTTSTTLRVVPKREGVCVVTFSNDVDSNTFSVLIIVTN